MTKKNNEEQTKEKTAQEEEVISIPLDNIEDDTSALAQRKADEYKDHLQRLQAEFDNYRKRTAENSRQSRSDGICDVIAELLPAIDNLERGIGAVADTSAKSGMELILKQLSEILTKFDVCEIKALGEQFNPDYHHAIARDGEGGDEHTVTEVYVKGYQRKAKVLRPSMVKVSNK